MIKKIGVFLLLFGSSFAQINPESIRKRMIANPNIQRTKGELFTWHAAYGIKSFYYGYEVYKEEKWIEEAIKYFDFLISKMEKAPDGYLGWIGPRIENKKLWGSAIVGDANLIAPMLEISEIILNDENLKGKYGKKAEEYINLAEEVIYRKWDSRGCWFQQGQYGKYFVQTKFIDPENPGKWVEIPSMRISENLNKSGKMGICFLRLYRITGKEEYRDRAEKIFSYYKFIMRYDKENDRYIWNFWEPFDICDMEGRTPRSWVDVHPNRAGYQAAEVSFFVEAYHTGVVFDQKDIKRFINTNLWMWDKSFENPRFKSANGKTNAGTLWDALWDFDDTIRKLSKIVLSGKKDIYSKVKLLYLEDVVMKNPVSFERKYVKDKSKIKVVEVPLFNSKDISMAVVIPMIFKDRTLISCKVEKDGGIEIFLYDEKGNPLEKIDQKFLEKGRYYTIRWNGESKTGQKYKGNFRIRFIFNNGESVREVPIKIGGEND